MSFNVKFKKEIESLRLRIRSLQSELDVIDDYGYVGYYEDESDRVVDTFNNIETHLEKAESILEGINDLIRDQFQY